MRFTTRVRVQTNQVEVDTIIGKQNRNKGKHTHNVEKPFTAKRRHKTSMNDKCVNHNRD